MPKLRPRFKKAVFLGYNDVSSSWKVGTFVEDERFKSQVRFAVYETRDVKFCESVLIDNVDSLRPGYKEGVVVSDDQLLSVVGGSMGRRPVVAASQQCARAPTSTGGSNSREVEGGSIRGPEIPGAPTLAEEFSVSEDENDGEKQSKTIVRRKKKKKASNVSVAAVASKEKQEDEKSSSPPATEKQIPNGAEQGCDSPSDVVFGRSENAKRKRGRPKGAKDKIPRKKRGAKVKVNLAGVDEGQLEKQHLETVAECYTVDDAHTDVEEGEEVQNVWCQLTVKEALASPDAHHWLAGIDKEKVKLHSFKTWRALTDEELDEKRKEGKQVLPIVLILTRKRDGTFKCRAVALGNLYHPSEYLEVYAPVVSQPANRYLLVEAAAEGDAVELFDIDNAFVQALIDAEVFVRLPEVWREDENDTGIRKLVKALYGLPQAPRLWNKHYEEKLIKLDWEQSEEKGLWRKPSKQRPGKFLKLGVYVDDNTGTGSIKSELKAEIQKVLDVFPGKWIRIPYENMGDGWVRYDQLGADVWYNQRAKSLKVCMERYIQKIEKKFRLEGCRKADTPVFKESELYNEQSQETKFPLREAVGCLQWAAVVCRPDISSPTNCLARVTGRKITKATVNCCKKVLRYLISTKTVGIEYSPENERLFNEIYRKLLAEGKELKDWNLFTDASFASDFVTLKSISGSIMYYRSCPIQWKSSRQSIRTNSTFESEFVAASDGLIVSETLTFRGFFEANDEEPDLWIDNETAVTVAKKPTDEQRPRSRHVALRYHKVKDYCEKINFCPTEHMKADSLTKVGVSKEIRDNIFHHNPNMINARKWKEVEEECESSFVLFPAVAPVVDLFWLECE